MKQPSYFFAAISHFFAATFGRVNWSSPPWVRSLRRTSVMHPMMFWSSTIGLVVVLLAGAYGYCWYKNLPKPQLITAAITIPKITTIQENELVIDPLTIDFGLPDAGGNFITQAVAPLKQIGKEVNAGIEMLPSMDGKWVWENDSRLVFTPSKDWPAGQKFTLHFTQDSFANGIKMQTLNYSFSTVPFTANITEFLFYQDPVNSKLRQATATINFNYPVETASLENHTSLILQSLKNNKLNLDAKHYKFTISYDKYKRNAYVRSEPLSLSEVARYLMLTVNKGVKSASGGDTTFEFSKNLLIPDSSNYFKVAAATASIVRNEQDKPEQVLTVETSLGVTETEIKKSLHVYLLPQNYPATTAEEEKKDYEWQNPGEISANILALSSPLPLQAIPADGNYASLHSYKFKTQTPRYIYIKIDKGTRGFGDFLLSHDYSAVIKVPEYPKEIGFIHKGALLALSGEKKLSVLIRGLPAVKFEFARVLPENINQLVTQTGGDFNNPYFINQTFNQQNISEIYSEIQQFDASDLTKQQYTALDFSKYLSAATNAGGPQGLFLLQANGWDLENQQPLDIKANRLILITDLGLVVKDNQDGSHDIFVQSITAGTPLANVNVSILGKNGLPLLSYTTDAQGRASFPSLSDYLNEREPVVYLAANGNDVSFIPYNNANRQLNYSRYDIGGIYSNNQEQHSLSAYIFSDRGIYRPGDPAHVGMIVKQAYAQPQPPGLTLEATITDPRGTTVEDKKFTLDAMGYLTLDFTTSASSPTGQYMVSLYIVKDKHPENLLGSMNFRVAEFQPDRMRIKASLSQLPSEGWIAPTGLTAKIQLWNLYGAPATDRRVGGKILLEPKRIEFGKFPEYIFADPLLDPSKPPKVFTDTLTDTKTDENGQAEFNLQLERFEKASYQLTFFAEGFESEGGRSVTTSATALVSPQSYFVGYKADGPLSYIKQNSQRSVGFIAVNPKLNQQAVNDLKIQIVAQQPVSTLVKNPNGTYQYQSIVQSKVLSTKPFTISEQGAVFALPTDKIGDFALNILAADNTELSHFNFGIIGASQQPLAKNAELTIKLDKEEYKAGGDIELQITAPFTGAGLITIERDKVYAVQWFKSDTTSSVQKIHIPEDFQGNGYINVAFVRDWNSPDIFISPLSYSVVPFSVDHDTHAIHIDLATPALAKPGEPFIINYHSDKPGKIIVFAIDEGILQVANYQTPDPLAFFFQKRALEVLTQQTVDQILPEYIRERELSAVGGDGGEDLLSKNLNPFKRKTDLPVAYWSGIVDTDITPRQLTYDVPDYFNGTLRVMAVAVALDSVGANDKKSEIRGNFVINPNTPTFVAPGDEFEISASIANNVEASGADAKIAVQLKVTPELEIIGSANETLVIGEGREQTVRFKLRATNALGSARMTLVASSGDKSSSMDSTLSVRPATKFFTSVASGMSKEAKKLVTVDRSLYPEYRTVEGTISSSPLILVAGLQRYVENFPYGCSEQLTSKAMPLLAIANQSWFAGDPKVIAEKIATTIQMLGQRQMSNGGFSYWPGIIDNSKNNFVSVYAMHFLTEAKAHGYNVSADMFSAGIGFLKDFAGQTPVDSEMARNQAYAIYILTRNEIVTTNFLTNLQLYLDQDQTQAWQHELTGAYIAATYQLLKSASEANQLIDKYTIQTQASPVTDFYDVNIANAQYLYLLANHFPERLAQTGEKLVLQLVEAINRDDINTILSAYTSLALGAYAQSDQTTTPPHFVISEILADKSTKLLAQVETAFGKASIDGNAKQIIFGNPDKKMFIYQLIQAGFDEKPPSAAVQKGVEIFREYRDSHGDVVTNASLGGEIEVHIQARALGNHYLTNIAIVDLLPGGFEVVRDSVKNEDSEYIDIREDRVIFFGGLASTSREIVYRIKATNTGKYTVPPIFAESMYDPTIRANSVVGTITVANVH